MKRYLSAKEILAVSGGLWGVWDEELFYIDIKTIFKMYSNIDAMDAKEGESYFIFSYLNGGLYFVKKNGKPINVDEIIKLTNTQPAFSPFSDSNKEK